VALGALAAETTSLIQKPKNILRQFPGSQILREVLTFFSALRLMQIRLARTVKKINLERKRFLL
jgi:hypothetical protein